MSYARTGGPFDLDAAGLLTRSVTGSITGPLVRSTSSYVESRRTARCHDAELLADGSADAGWLDTSRRRHFIALTSTAALSSRTVEHPTESDGSTWATSGPVTRSAETRGHRSVADAQIASTPRTSSGRRGTGVSCASPTGPTVSSSGSTTNGVPWHARQPCMSTSGSEAHPAARPCHRESVDGRSRIAVISSDAMSASDRTRPRSRSCTSYGWRPATGRSCPAGTNASSAVDADVSTAASTFVGTLQPVIAHEARARKAVYGERHWLRRSQRNHLERGSRSTEASRTHTMVAPRCLVTDAGRATDRSIAVSYPAFRGVLQQARRRAAMARWTSTRTARASRCDVARPSSSPERPRPRHSPRPPTRLYDARRGDDR